MPRTNIGAEGSALSTQQAINAGRSRKGYKPYDIPLFDLSHDGDELEILTDLGENAHVGSIQVDRSVEVTPALGDIGVQFMEGDDTTYGEIKTVLNGVVFSLKGMDVKKIKLHYKGINCAVYVFVKKA